MWRVSSMRWLTVSQGTWRVSVIVDEMADCLTYLAGRVAGVIIDGVTVSHLWA